MKRKPSLGAARKWAGAFAANDLLPFSFQYDGRSSQEAQANEAYYRG